MQIDVDRYIGAVAREVGTAERDGRPARVVVARRDYAASIADIWDALTRPGRLSSWFLPVSGDLRPGGRYQFEGNAGGEITACEPPRSVAATWEFGGETSWVEVRLRDGPRPDLATLELVHTAHVGDDLWEQFGPGAVGVGWDLALMGLGLHLVTGTPVDRAAAEAWTGSEEGKSFIRGSSDDWARASIAAGTDAAAATAAAARTTAFYTGEEEAPQEG